MSFEEELQKFKENESPEDVIPLLENPSLQKIAIAWPKIAIQIRPTKTPCPKEKNEIWQWLWDQIDYNPEQLLELSRQLREATSRYEKIREKTGYRDDDAFYLVVVFKSHEERKKWTDAHGLEDNRFIDAPTLLSALEKT